jgi:hypothetical protein
MAGHIRDPVAETVARDARARMTITTPAILTGAISPIEAEEKIL